MTFGTAYYNNAGLTVTANGTSGQALLSAGASAPGYGNLAVGAGGTGLTTLTTAYGVVCAGTTATGALQNAGAGTSGQVLTSNGAAALPTFQTSTKVGTVSGDSGSVSGATISILANSGSANCGDSIKFSAVSATEMDLLVTSVSTENTFLGKGTGKTGNSGANNSFFGAASATAITSGNYNAGCGWAVLNVLTTGSGNIGVGSGPLVSLTTGSNNIALGSYTGTRNTADAYTSSESSNIIIQNSGVAAESNKIRIGTAGSGAGQQNACYIAGIDGVTITGAAVLCSTSGQLGDVVSSLKFKENIKDISDRSILDLHPVQFNYISDKDKTPCFGMIAEEVEKVFPELVLYKEGSPYSLKYHEMPALLLNEIQKLRKEIDELKALKG